MKRIISTLFALTALLMVEARVINFNDSWRFSFEDNAIAKDVKFDDSTWRDLALPHDWAHEAGYHPLNPQKDKGGYGAGGVGWYRKSFNIEQTELAENLYFIDFEGVYMNSEVWINGEYLGKRPYGYIPFSYELTPHIRTGENVIAVRVDSSLEPSARWYHGCGIYANVDLRIKNNVYFEKDGTFVQTPTMGDVAVTSEIVARKGQKITLNYNITNLEGVVVAEGSHSKLALVEGLQVIPFDLKVNNPDLWSPETPSLYRLNIEITDAKRRVVDEQSIRFGFRTIEWFADSGMHLNGKQYKMRGVCEHLEGGPTGALSTESIVRWKMQMIKDMGCNAVRFTHNPFLPVYYEVCDEIGLLVMDEIFDGWHQKADFDYGLQAFDEWWERDVEAWIRRDRNHASVFLYSVGNETEGDIAPKLVEACHRVDPTRLVTSGDCNPDDMDVYGVNGRSEMIEAFMDKWDKRKPFVATENPHTWQVRGYYRTQTWYRDGYPNVRQGTQYVPNLTEKEIFAYDWIAPEGRRGKKQVFNSSYDNAFVRVTARHLIEQLRDREWFSGSFRWTGFDYRGEAGYVHGGWPFRAFQSGPLDLAGFEKDLYHLYRSQWSSEDVLHILPHWTHPVMEQGTLIPVWVYSNGDEVELFQDGKSLGRKSRGERWNEMQLEWMVPWREGRIEAVAYRNGKEIARTAQQSAGAPTKLSLSEYDQQILGGERSDLSIITIEQQDSKDVLYPYGENRIYAKIYGDARMLAFENGSPVDVEGNFEADSKCSFMGLNRMFIEKSGKSAKSVVVASILGDKKLMVSDMVTIDVKEYSIDGDLPKRSFEIRYTTDGSEPTKGSTLYSDPFAVALGTTVRAKLYDGNEVIFSMQERFAEDAGLYWGVAGEEVCAFDGLQAEEAKMDKAWRTNKDGDGYYASGYVMFSQKGGSLTFYQENDGTDYDAEIIVRYAQQTKDGSTTTMEIFNNDTSLGVFEFKNTGSNNCHWAELTLDAQIGSGANNIKFVALGDESPTIDQIKIINKE